MSPATRNLLIISFCCVYPLVSFLVALFYARLIRAASQNYPPAEHDE